MSRGYLTIETALAVILVFMVLDLILSVYQDRPESLFTIREGDTSCDIQCLLDQE